MISESEAGLSKLKVLIYFVLLFLIVTLTYKNHFHNSFHFDDSHTIENNLFIQDIHNIPFFFKDGTTFSSLPQNQSYRPIVSTSLAIDYWIGKGYDLFYFHLSSFIIFLLQGVLMFFMIYKIFDISYKNNWNFYIASVAGAWYLLHPANAETINYIIARSDLQSTFFVILGFILYIYSTFCKKYFLYLIPVCIGALAKPPAVMFAPLLFFYIILFEKDLSLSDIFKKMNYKILVSSIIKVIPAFIVCALIYLWIDHLTPKTWESGGSSRFNFMITQPAVILHYFIKFFFPFGLSADTDWTASQTIWNGKFFIGCAFIIVMLSIAVWFSKDKRLRPISYGIVWFFLALIPSSSIIPFAEVLNDHRVFFPYVGLVISVCYTIGLLLMSHKKHYENAGIKYELSVLFTILILLSGYAYGTSERNKVWNTEETLWVDVTIKSPKNARGLMNYGLSKMSSGNYVEAERYFTAAISLWPNYSLLYINMGVLKDAMGDQLVAEDYFKTGLEKGSLYPDAWFFYGKFLCNHSMKMDRAIPILEHAIALSPAHLGAHIQLMIAYNNMQEWEKLKALAEKTLEINPDNVDANKYWKIAEKNKGKKFDVIIDYSSPEELLDISLHDYNAGQYRDCIAACESAVKLKPDYADAYSNMGASYNKLMQWDKAIESCNKALLINPNHKLAKGNLDWALREKNKK